MSNKLFISMVLASLILLTLSPICSSANDTEWWSENWSFRQELPISIDTGSKNAKYQPIDIGIKFDNSCWAKNEKEHSVRVIFQEDGALQEIESQIYDLNYSDEKRIISCSLVFLIPEEASGKEKYYVYYDDKEKPGPNYPDHIEVGESYYRYEPIPGYPFESYYYKITEDGYVVYGVAIEGKFLGVSTSQQVTLFKEQTKDITTPKDGMAWASFDYFYYYGNKDEEFSSTVQTLISKEILIDGNLMVEFGIISESSKEDFRTAAIYKYYYCPDHDYRRIYAHVKHEALKESHVSEKQPYSMASGNIAGFQVGSVKSPSISDLNFGKMFPYMHICSENGMIFGYPLDIDPEYSLELIKILNTDSDVDLGKKAWVSFDEGKTGVAHSLIFGSNSILVSGTDERDGIQIKAEEGTGPGLLGLESHAETFYCTRNSYEKGSIDDLNIPADFVVEYDAEFFSTSKGGYPDVDNESDLFQILAKSRPSQKGEISEKKEKEKTNTLTAYLHLAPSVPMGTFLSLITGRNISYISAELYCNDELLATGIGERLSINPLPNFENEKLIKKFVLALRIFDWKNFSFFKKIRFENLQPGKYLVKIYRENPFLREEKKYIGFKIVEVTKDTKIHIFCRPQGTVKLSVFDQEREGIKDVKVILKYDNTTISECTTNQKGTATINAPCNFKDKYNLELFYKGFVVYREPIKLRYIQSFVPVKKSINFELYDLNLKVKDTWGLPLEYEINPILTSKEMDEKILITAVKENDGSYFFNDLCPAEYQLELNYKSFHLEKNIKIPTNNEEKINLIFPAEFKVKTYIFDSRGNPLKDTKIEIDRDEKKIEIESDEIEFIQFSLPPGSYNVKAYLKDDLICKRKINIISDRTLNLVTNKEPIFPIITIYASVIFVALGAFFTIRKKDATSLLKILAVALAVIALVCPWWALNGSSPSSNIETSTKMFLTPPKMVTVTTASDVITGELANLPKIFTDVMTILSILIAGSCILIVLNIIFRRFNKNRLSFVLISIGITFLAGSIIIFYFAMSLAANLGVGSIAGEGNIDVNIFGEGLQTSVYGNWGPSSGFYLCLLSIVAVASTLLFEIRKTFRAKNINLRKSFDKKNLIKYIKKFMPLIGVILLVFLIVNIGTDKIASTFLKLSPIYIIIAASLTIPRLIIINFQWQLVLKKQKIRIGYIKSLKIYLMGYFYAALTPGYMGQLMRIPYLKDETNEPVGKLFVNTYVQTSLHTLSLYCMMIIGTFLVIDKIPQLFPLACAYLLANIIFYIYFLKRERGEKTLHFLVKLLIPKSMKPHLTKFVDTFYKDFPNIKGFILPFIVGIPEWILIYSQIYILGLSLNIEIPYFTFLMLYPIANVVAFIPITTAGLGTREAMLILLFSFYGVPPEKALVISLAGHLLTDVLTGFYGFIISVAETKNNKKSVRVKKFSR